MAKVDEGNVCTVFKGTVVDSVGKSVIAHVKHMPPRAILIECVSALIARASGLSTPRPLLVNVPPYKVPELPLKGNTIFFGSEDVGFPSLARIAKVENAAPRLKKWSQLLLAGCFDEFIANADRHQGNIIYGGGDSYTLIDHSHAVPVGHDSKMPIQTNTFLTLVAPESHNDLLTHNLKRKAEKYVANFARLTTEDWRSLTRYHLYCPEDKASEVLNFLKDRLPILTQFIAQKLGERQIDLYASNHPKPR